MLDYHSRSHTDDWSQTETRAAAVQANVPAAPAYAWSVEPAAEYPAPAGRLSRMARPMMFVGVGAGATAAVAAALVFVFSGPTRSAEVATPNASTAITAVPTKADVPSTPPAVPSVAPRHQVHRSASSSPVAPQHAPTSYSSNDTTSNDRTDSPQYREGWRPWHDTTSPTWNFPFLRPHFDSQEHLDGDHDGSRGHHDRQSDDRDLDSSSDRHQ